MTVKAMKRERATFLQATKGSRKDFVDRATLESSTWSDSLYSYMPPYMSALRECAMNDAHLASARMNLTATGAMPLDYELVARVHAVSIARGAVTIELPARWRGHRCTGCPDDSGSAASWTAVPCGHTTLCGPHAAAVSLLPRSFCPLCLHFVGVFARAADDEWVPSDAERAALFSGPSPRMIEAFDAAACAVPGSPARWLRDAVHATRNLWTAHAVDLSTVVWTARFQEPDTHAVTTAALREADGAITVPWESRPTLLVRLFPDASDALHATGDMHALELAAARASRAGLDFCRAGAAAAAGVTALVARLRNDAMVHAASLKALGVLGSTAAAADAAALLPVRTFADAHLTPHQRAAVQAVVLGAHGSVPYLLIGPAGCGKTRVLSEMLAQLVARGERVLLAGPSDPATDVVVADFTERHGATLDALSATLLRVNAPSRSVDSLLKPTLRRYCTFSAMGDFARPPHAELRGAAVVACAFGALALLGADADAPDGRAFTVVIVDESSQAVEPESLLALVAAPRARVVLAGDPRQLGAVIRSPHARAKGLGISLQERLLAGRPTTGGHVVSAMRAYEQFVRDALDPVCERQTRLRDAHEAGAADGAASVPVNDYAVEAAAEATLLRDARLVRVYDAAPAALRALGGEDDGGVDGGAGASAIAHLWSTTLTTNFRSSQGLLELPSRLFYTDTPLFSAQRASDGLAAFSLVSAARRAGGAGGAASWPTLAIGVAGRDVKDDVVSETLNLRNAAETAAVVFVIRALLGEARDGAPSYEDMAPRAFWLPGAADGDAPRVEMLPAPDHAPLPGALPVLNQGDVGVIVPFRAAILEIRAALRLAGLGNVSVGLPMNFQGQEKRVIVVCTIVGDELGPAIFARRGAPVDVEPADDAPLRAPTLGAAMLPPAGLFFDPKSLNVALTRAHDLLVLIGNPRLWRSEPSWRVILQAAVDRGTYRGFDGLPPPVSQASGLW